MARETWFVLLLAISRELVIGALIIGEVTVGGELRDVKAMPTMPLNPSDSWLLTNGPYFLSRADVDKVGVGIPVDFAADDGEPRLLQVIRQD
jgi:hypothetical protein